MREVRTDRNIWKDLVLWYVVAAVVFFIVEIIILSVSSASVGFGNNLFGGLLGFFFSGIWGIFFAGVAYTAITIYKIYYFYHLTQDLNTVCSHVERSEEENSWNYIIVWLLDWLTVGAYGLYWIYKQGGRLHDTLGEYRIKTQETGLMYFLWNTLGAIPLGGFISDYLLIKNLNKACIAYTKGVAPQSARQEEPRVSRPVMSAAPVDDDDDVTRSVPVIVCIKGEYAGQELTVSQGQEIVMGRDAQKANLIFSSEKISKIHCRITFNARENCYYVTDYSRNGVTVSGGKRLEAGHPERLNRGTQITLGESEVFQLR
ncbi:MAG: FHA domain-containing protein [Eubacteriales bacterium]|nr:FHA domain-containing protein [Eubacteriales bacterium]